MLGPKTFLQVQLFVSTTGSGPTHCLPAQMAAPRPSVRHDRTLHHCWVSGKCPAQQPPTVPCTRTQPGPRTPGEIETERATCMHLAVLSLAYSVQVHACCCPLVPQRPADVIACQAVRLLLLLCTAGATRVGHRVLAVHAGCALTHLRFISSPWFRRCDVAVRGKTHSTCGLLVTSLTGAWRAFAHMFVATGRPLQQRPPQQHHLPSSTAQAAGCWDHDVCRHVHGNPHAACERVRARLAFARELAF